MRTTDLRMKFFAASSVCSALLAGVLLAGCAAVKHVPPGQSLSVATAKKPELVALPAPPLRAAQPVDASVEPPVQTEKVADSFTLGNLCLQEGRYQEAIH